MSEIISFQTRCCVHLSEAIHIKTNHSYHINDRSYAGEAITIVGENIYYSRQQQRHQYHTDQHLGTPISHDSQNWAVSCLSAQ